MEAKITAPEDLPTEGITDEEILDISRDAWGQAQAIGTANNIVKKLGWNGLTLPKKQKAILEFQAGIIKSPQFQYRYTKWGLENPGDMMRLFMSSIPKEAQITVTHEGNVVLLPAKMGSVQDWLTEVKANPDGEAESNSTPIDVEAE
jgi:hypothetical protein